MNPDMVRQSILFLKLVGALLRYSILDVYIRPTLHAHCIRLAVGPASPSAVYSSQVSQLEVVYQFVCGYRFGVGELAFASQPLW